MTCNARAFACLAVVAMVTVHAPRAGADDLGKQIFQEGGGGLPACAICHTLSDAGAAGEIGPNLDEMKPAAARVRIAVHDGVGVMPPFGEALSGAEIDAVAGYVARVAGR